MRLLLLILFLWSSLTSIQSQTLKGKVYDSKSTVKDIKVLNKTQNRLTVTDENGDFSIVANINDTISFESVFYHPKLVVAKQIHFDDIFQGHGLPYGPELGIVLFYGPPCTDHLSALCQ